MLCHLQKQTQELCIESESSHTTNLKVSVIQMTTFVVNPLINSKSEHGKITSIVYQKQFQGILVS